jgi:hypothetical protein
MCHLQAVLIEDVHSEPGEGHVTALLNAVRVMQLVWNRYEISKGYSLKIKHQQDSLEGQGRKDKLGYLKKQTQFSKECFYRQILLYRHL